MPKPPKKVKQWLFGVFSGMGPSSYLVGGSAGLQGLGLERRGFALRI